VHTAHCTLHTNPQFANVGLREKVARRSRNKVSSRKSADDGFPLYRNYARHASLYKYLTINRICYPEIHWGTRVCELLPVLQLAMFAGLHTQASQTSSLRMRRQVRDWYRRSRMLRRVLSEEGCKGLDVRYQVVRSCAIKSAQ
jgi:hypothetical protein